MSTLMWTVLHSFLLAPGPGTGGEASFPPSLPDGVAVASDASEDLLQPPATLRDGVAIARAPPRIEFLFFPGQDYPGNPWSAWGDSIAVEKKYYASIGDHRAPDGNAFVYEYDPATRQFRLLSNVRKLLDLPEGHYTPGKIHGRLDLGRDGWLYFSTHRGSTRVTRDEYHYRGDWIIRCHPVSAQAAVVVHAPVARHCIPASVLDPGRRIFYGGTAAGIPAGSDEDIRFFAYDVEARKLLHSAPGGPPRCMILAPPTGRVYFTSGKDDDSLKRFDPAQGGPPVHIKGKIGIRAATHETPRGYVYTVSEGRKGAEATIYAFNTRTEEIQSLGPAGVGGQNYITSIDADSTGRYLYYVPGAHGGSEADGSPVVQFDIETMKKKVIAFLHPFYAKKYGCTLKGTFSSAVDPAGDKLYITWNNSRGGRVWDTCVLTVIHIPEGERRP